MGQESRSRRIVKRAAFPGTASLAGASLLLVALVFVPVAQGSDWPQWRGPNRDGIAPGAKLPAVLPAALHQVWKSHVGEGQSSPIVVGDRLFVHARQGEEEVVLALSAATGRTVAA